MLKISPLADTPSEALRMAGEASTYLRRLAEVDDLPDYDAALDMVSKIDVDTPIDVVMRTLRRAKAGVHRALAAEDLSRRRTVMEITAALTDFADASLAAAMRAALGVHSVEGNGFFAIALGKMGAHELNYSSDIDVCVFYDPNIFDGGALSPGEAAQRVTREIVRLMTELTGDGYVFRTDLRLRPDPGSTPLAVSTDMAELYYESVGQNWERMVWIKARACAGDMATAQSFLEGMKPFVWRRNLDYWAIGDIQAIKRMINAKAGSDGLENVSPNIKLGPGGIREIEFFVQTQQLILGGRHTDLRDHTTLGALKALAEIGIVEQSTADNLRAAYVVLRDLEHRLQMRTDAQTHTVPESEGARGDIATLCGYSDLATFDADVLATRRMVHEAYLALFAEEDRRAAESRLGNLVFTGVDDDPGTVNTLIGLGFSDASGAIDTIRNWHRGGVPATRTARGRELLTAILPQMLEAMGQTGEPDEAFRWFSRFFEGLSSGVQTLSMLLAEPALLEDLVATLALAPRLAAILSRRPDLLEALVSGQAPEPPPISDKTSFDTAMDDWRRYQREQSFLIGHRLLHGRIAASEAARHWSRLADQSLIQMSEAALHETQRQKGEAPGRYAVFAMGKLGGAEMTAGSDLDIILIYDAEDPGAAGSWFTRLTQRLITALSAPTAEGALYEVDMRLRPSGRGGPVAVSLPAFGDYQRTAAWTWEHMAMTRLRFVAGDAALGAEVIEIARAAIAERAARNTGAIGIDVSDMRRLLHTEKPGQGLWDMKMTKGGLVDIEFVAQQEQLLCGDDDLVHSNTETALAALHKAGRLGDKDWKILSEGLGFFQAIQQVQRIAVGEGLDPKQFPEGLKDRLCRAVQIDAFEALERELSVRKAAISAISSKKLQMDATE
jgi:glutamate-ammonia-ligase adenylyltransferase